MTPMEALHFIDRVADGGLGGPDYAEAFEIVKNAIEYIEEMEEKCIQLGKLNSNLRWNLGIICDAVDDAKKELEQV